MLGYIGGMMVWQMASNKRHAILLEGLNTLHNIIGDGFNGKQPMVHKGIL